MEITRIIDGKEVKIELTEQELKDAYKKQEFIYDCEEVSLSLDLWNEVEDHEEYANKHLPALMSFFTKYRPDDIHYDQEFIKDLASVANDRFLEFDIGRWEPVYPYRNKIEAIRCTVAEAIQDFVKNFEEESKFKEKSEVYKDEITEYVTEITDEEEYKEVMRQEDEEEEEYER